MYDVDLMIFDFDGTLVDSGGDLADAVNHTLRELQLPARDTGDVLGYIGDGVAKLIERALGDTYAHRGDDAMRTFTEYYRAHLLDTTRLYPGVDAVLDYFRGKKKIIVTNKRAEFTRKIAAALQIDYLFDGMFCIDECPWTKPDPRLVEWILPDISPIVDRKRIVIIGDGINDVMLAKRAGIASCALLNGYTGRGELLEMKPDFYCEQIHEIKHLFC